jgi:hypothetical protein
MAKPTIHSSYSIYTFFLFISSYNICIVGCWLLLLLSTTFLATLIIYIWDVLSLPQNVNDRKRKQRTLQASSWEEWKPEKVSCLFSISHDVWIISSLKYLISHLTQNVSKNFHITKQKHWAFRVKEKKNIKKILISCTFFS